MKGLRKRIIVLAAAAALAMTSFVGCAGVKDSDIVATVGDSEITVAMANFYARLQQPSFEEYYVAYQDYMQQQMYGSVIQETQMDWGAEQEEGVTLEESFKQDVMTSLQNMYLTEDYMGDYDVKLTDAELEKINEVAKAFIKANNADAREKISADKETVIEYLRMVTISAKVDAAIKATVDKNVPDEDVAQKRFRYVSFVKTKTGEDSTSVKMSDDEIKKVKKEANDFLAAAKENGSLETYAKEKEATSNKMTYGADYKDDEALTLPKEVYDTVETLKEKEFAKVIDTESAFYVVQLESNLDEEATKTEREGVISEREEKAVSDALKKWKKETKITVYDKVWDKISMRELNITVKEVEESKEDKKEDTATENKKEDTTKQ